MKFSSIYTTEFLSELNLIITQEDFGNKMYDLLTPIKNLFEKDNDLLTYSLARYCGANSRLAFFCEWYLLSNRLITDSNLLLEENKKHFLKKVDLRYKNLRNLDKLVEEDIIKTFLPLQMSFISLKAKEFIDELLAKHIYLTKYLNSAFLSQFTTSELQLHKSLYSDSITLNQYIEIQGSRTSFLYVCMPCLLAFTYSFNQDDNVVNPKGIKWSLVEDIFKQIAALHQMKDDPSFIRVVYAASLDQSQEISWLEMDDEIKSKMSQENDAALEVIQMLRSRVYEKLSQDLGELIFPDKYKDMLKEIVEWAYQDQSSTLNP